MSLFKDIYSIRDTPHPSYWDIVFEWEDDFSRTLQIPVLPVGQSYDNIYKPSLARKAINRVNGFQKLDRLFFHPDGYHIAFHIGPPGVYSFHSRLDVVPVIVDFWATEDLRRFEKIFRYSKAVVITSREAYAFLLDKQIDLPLHHVALSLPDKYLLTNLSANRDIDLIQVGRRNQRLDEYARRFVDEFPGTHYVAAERRGSAYHLVSNILGDLGTFADRASYLQLLMRSKVSLVSAPGMDSDKLRTGGFSPVTPRFLESCACACHLIAAYPDNEDFRWYEMSSIAPSVDNYSRFRETALAYISSAAVPDYTAFLRKHVTSVRAKQLSTALLG